MTNKHLSSDLALSSASKQIHGKFRAYNGIVGHAITQDEYDAFSSMCETELELERCLLRAGVGLEAIGIVLAKFHGHLYHRFNTAAVKPDELMSNLKRPFIDSVGWSPIELSRSYVTVVSHQFDFAIGKIAPSSIWKKKTIWMVTTALEYAQYVDWLFDKSISLDGVDDDFLIDDLISSLDKHEDEDEDEDRLVEVSQVEENEVVRIINKTVLDAYRRGISDIHVEPTYRSGCKSSVLIRFRQDGEMLRYAEIPYRLRYALASRLKILASIDITERRLPQDGKIKMSIGSKELELRVATIASASGRGSEDVVMRILSGSKQLPVDKMRFSSNNLASIKNAIAKPYGLFLVCGPTGSGKTTTLHSILGYLNTDGVKIITAEDPVEITQDGLRQIQVNAKAGLDFSRVMRSMLRLDPDIIMVGEMRDKETVKMAIEASLTGHLVFSTLHTNSAPESINRLLNMGMNPFNFADALLGVLAQRLCKTLCASCKELHVASQLELDDLMREYCYELLGTSAFKDDAATNDILKNLVSLYGENGEIKLGSAKQGGCDVCAGTGYKGQMALHELLIGTDRVKLSIQRAERPAEMMIVAMEEGMRTLKQDGIEKVLQGIITVHEVRKVCIK
ncbi:MAG: GspE/PulE family protein [Gallionella sp.]